MAGNPNRNNDVIFFVVISGFVAALLAPLIFRVAGRTASWGISAIPFLLFGWLLTWIGPVSRLHQISVSHAWIPGLDIAFSFLVDGLSLFLALLITGIGGFVFLYSRDYLGDDPRLGSFYAFLLLFMGSMLGMVFSGNLISMYIFWELTTISSFLLIGFHHEEREARRAAVQALVVTNAGGLALLAGLILLAKAGGGFEWGHLLTRGEAVRGHPLYTPILLLVLFGAFTKSAQVPFHFWLPNAMQAPTPVSAYLHSATMVKAGVYLLARMHPVLGGTEMWFVLLAAIGGLSLITGGFMALVQRDIKRMLAYSTISVLGLLIMMLGIGSEAAVKAAMIYLLAHALYKATLFLCAGAIDHETKNRDITRMAGLGRVMPLIAAAGVAAGFSKSGLPPAIGYIGKEHVFKAVLGTGSASVILVCVSVFGSMFLAAIGWLAGIRPFFGRRNDFAKAHHKMPFALWIGPLFLGVSGFVLGVFPEISEKALLQPAAAAVSAHAVKLKMTLWEGIHPPLALAAAALAGGLVLYASRGWVARLTGRWGALGRPGPDRLYDILLKYIEQYGALQTRIIQSGYLHRYLQVIFIFTAGLILFGLAGHGGIMVKPFAVDLVNFLALALSVLIFAAIVVVLRSPSMMAAVIALGVIGYSLSLFYVLYSAPDVALTQILVETVTLVLFALIIYRLPGLKPMSRPLGKGLDAVVAASVGFAMMLLILKTGALGVGDRISGYFAQNSVLLAHGKNVVNVILVDFRSLDTMGEITVLAITAIGVFSLLQLKMPENGK